ncbi:hypothetical protein, partial [Salmonella sp. s54925]|uniref:hypothetical protein n=2 Tax=unclassified Salmonella TaxID=2614656 RepID=UPI00397ED751
FVSSSFPFQAFKAKMSEEIAKLERDNTMVATAKEGEAFLEGKGKVDEDAKTRGQQKDIEEITATEDDDVTELKRTRTMIETAKEGKDLLDGEELGKTRSKTESEKNGKEEEEDEEESSEPPEENGKDKEDKDEPENGSEDAEEETNGKDEDDEKSPLKRTRTMVETVKEGEEFLKKQKVDNDSGEQEAKS